VLIRASFSCSVLNQSSIKITHRKEHRTNGRKPRAKPSDRNTNTKLIYMKNPKKWRPKTLVVKFSMEFVELLWVPFIEDGHPQPCSI